MIEQSRISPQFYPNSERVVIRWFGDDSVVIPRLLGDHTGWLPVEGVCVDGESNIFEWDFSLKSDARIEYAFEIGTAFPVTDPLNPNKVNNGFGVLSELMMPDYVTHPALEGRRTGIKGSAAEMNEHQLKSKYLGYDVTFIVDDRLADADVSRNSLIIFNDGLDYIEFADSAHILSWLTREGRIPPHVAVYVCPPNRHLSEPPNRTHEYGLNSDYSNFLIFELIPFVESHYGLACEPSKRVIIGDSYAGMCSLFVALSHPEVIGGAYCQSGYVGFRSDTIFDLVLKAGRHISFVFDIGYYETNVGSNFLDPAELDFLSANLRLKKVLDDHAIPHVFDQQSQGHTWGFWRDGLLNNLPKLFEHMKTKTMLPK